MEEFENIFVGIISFAGTARSCYIEAIQEAKKVILMLHRN